MKGQMGIMEYLIMSFFIVMIVIVLMFFLSGYQITQFAAEKHQTSIDRALLLTKQVSFSPLFTKENGVFDDGKLTALNYTTPDVCTDLKDIFGDNWFFEIQVLDGSDVITPCTQTAYPDCNYWSFCQQSGNSIAFDLPVNVYRNTKTPLETDILPGIDIALLKVGVYVE